MASILYSDPDNQRDILTTLSKGLYHEQFPDVVVPAPKRQRSAQDSLLLVTGS